MRRIFYYLMILFTFHNIEQELLGQSINNLGEQLYSTEQFLLILNKYPESEREIFLKDLDSKYSGTSFRKSSKFDERLWEYMHVPKGTDGLSSLFHFYTNYSYYSYENLNQFEKRRLTAEHTSKLSDESFIKSLRKDFYLDIEFEGSILKEFNFDDYTFTLDLDKLFGEKTFILSNMRVIDEHVPGYDLNYYISLHLINPQEVQLYIDDLKKAEEISKNEFILRFYLTPSSKIFKDSKTKDVSTYSFDVYQQKYSQIIRKNYDDSLIPSMMKDEIVVKSYMEDTRGALGPAFKRNIYFKQNVTINQVEIISDNITRQVWRTPKFYYQISKVDFKSFHILLLKEREEKEGKIRKNELLARRKKEIKNNPDFNWFKEGNELYNDNKLEEAIDHYRTCIVATPSRINKRECYENIAASFWSLGTLDSAIENYIKVIKLSYEPWIDENSLRIRVKLGQLYLKTEREADAISEFKYVSTSENTDDLSRCNALYQLGRTAERENDLTGANKYYDEIDDLFENKWRQYRNDAKGLRKLNMWAGDAWFRKGVIYWKTQDYDNAIVSVKNYMNLYGKKNLYSRYMGNYYLGYIYSKSGDYSKAIIGYKEADKLFNDVDPGGTNPKSALGWVYYLKKDYKNSIKNSIKGLELDPGDSHTKYNLALAYLAKGEKDKAFREYDEAYNKFGVLEGAVVDLKDLMENENRTDDAKYVLTEILGIELE